MWAEAVCVGGWSHQDALLTLRWLLNHCFPMAWCTWRALPSCFSSCISTCFLKMLKCLQIFSTSGKVINQSHQLHMKVCRTHSPTQRMQYSFLPSTSIFKAFTCVFNRAVTIHVSKLKSRHSDPRTCLAVGKGRIMTQIPVQIQPYEL